jgi:hypothetical protein
LCHKFFLPWDSAFSCHLALSILSILPCDSAFSCHLSLSILSIQPFFYPFFYGFCHVLFWLWNPRYFLYHFFLCHWFKIYWHLPYLLIDIIWIYSVPI